MNNHQMQRLSDIINDKFNGLCVYAGDNNLIKGNGLFCLNHDGEAVCLNDYSIEDIKLEWRATDLDIHALQVLAKGRDVNQVPWHKNSMEYFRAYGYIKENVCMGGAKRFKIGICDDKIDDIIGKEKVRFKSRGIMVNFEYIPTIEEILN